MKNFIVTWAKITVKNETNRYEILFEIFATKKKIPYPKMCKYEMRYILSLFAILPFLMLVKMSCGFLCHLPRFPGNAKHKIN